MDDSKTNSVDVGSIFKSLCSILWKDVGLSLRELVGFCSNGTSVMRKMGVVVKFKQFRECKYMINVLQICHRLEWAGGDTVANFSDIVFFSRTHQNIKVLYYGNTETIKEIWNYFQLNNLVQKTVKLSLDANVDAV